MMQSWGFYLQKLCGLQLKPSSYEVIVAGTRMQESQVVQFKGVSWKKLPIMYSLGHSIACNGSQAEDRKRVHRSWEAAFWRNSKVLLCREINVVSRLQFWGMLSRGIGNYRYSMWRPTRSAATHMETLHNKILQRIVGARPLDDDTAESFCKRRNRVVADLRDRANLKISKQWSLALF